VTTQQPDHNSVLDHPMHIYLERNHVKPEGY
jgi:hypothetical protein